MRLVELQGLERDRMAEHLARHGWLTACARITAASLPFYPGMKFVRAEGEKMTQFGVMDNPSLAVPLNTIAGVHYINRMMRPVLNMETLFDYALFFTGILSVDGEEEFSIVGPDDMVGAGIKPEAMKLVGRDEDESFLVSGLMMHRDQVWQFKMAVLLSGMIDMLEDSALAQLPLPTVGVELRPQ